MAAGSVLASELDQPVSSGAVVAPAIAPAIAPAMEPVVEPVVEPMMEPASEPVLVEPEYRAGAEPKIDLPADLPAVGPAVEPTLTPEVGWEPAYDGGPAPYRPDGGNAASGRGVSGYAGGSDPAPPLMDYGETPIAGERHATDLDRTVSSNDATPHVISDPHPVVDPAADIGQPDIWIAHDDAREPAYAEPANYHAGQAEIDVEATEYSMQTELAANALQPTAAQVDEQNSNLMWLYSLVTLGFAGLSTIVFFITRRLRLAKK